MATLEALTQRVRENLYSQYPAEHPFVQALGAGYLISATTVVVPAGTAWSTGDILENLTTGEQMFIHSVSTNTLTVLRGYNGTTAAAGVANQIVAKNPKISTSQVHDALDAILYDLEGHGVHGYATKTFTLVTGDYLYPVDLSDVANPPGVIAVYREETATGVPQGLPYVQREHVGYTSPTGGILLKGKGSGQSGDTVYVLTGLRISSPALLPARVEESVVLGATGRLIGKMISPALQDPGHMSNRTVQPGQASRDARWYQGEYLLSVRREAANLAVEVSRLRSSFGDVVLNRGSRWRA